MSARTVQLNVGDEEGFIAYAEDVVFGIQKLLRQKEGIDTLGVPIIDISARLEGRL